MLGKWNLTGFIPLGGTEIAGGFPPVREGRTKRRTRGACGHSVMLLSQSHQLRVGGLECLGFWVSPYVIRNFSKQSSTFPFYLLIFTFFTAVRVPVEPVSCQPDNNIHAGSRQLDGASGREQNDSDGPPTASAWVSNCKGSPPRVLILRNTELNVNTRPLLRALRSEHGGRG